MGEGGTPLLQAANLGSEVGLGGLLLKDETRNPTGSFIDRGSTVLASLAKERGVETCTCVTTGNLGASIAAYCAKAGIVSEIVIRPGTDRGKLYQMIAYGARVEASRRRGEGGLNLGPRSVSVSPGNPYLLEGEKTTCFEVVQDLDWEPPDIVVLPVGTGGHLSMFWRAFGELEATGLVDMAETRLVGVRFSRSAAPAQGLDAELFTELEESEPALMGEARRAIEASRGEWVEVSADETIGATALLARTEGIFAEPAAASVVAALSKAKERRLVESGEKVVCVITGAGLKDTRAIARIARAAKQTVVADEYSVGRLQVGATKLRLLRMLSSGASFGYQMWKSISAEAHMTTASVYQHLGELEDLGLVRKAGVARAGGRERVLYELTRKGHDLLKMAGRIERP